MDIKKLARSTKCSVLNALVAMGMTAVAASEGTVQAPEGTVQLWENGPYWATNNVGQSEVPEHPEYGALYTFDGDAAKHAASSLGEGWRLPTKAECEKLLTCCTIERDVVDEDEQTIKGVHFKGTGDYASKSIFLPAAGEFAGIFDTSRSGDGFMGTYWSSDGSQEPGQQMYGIYFDLYDHFVSPYVPSSAGASVRAVWSPPSPMTITAFDAEKIYDGSPTNATYEASEADAWITVAYSMDGGKTWTDEEGWDSTKFTNVTNLTVRFTATKGGYKTAKSEAVQVKISPRPAIVKAPSRVYDDIDKSDEAIDEDISKNITIEGVLEGDEITVCKWVLEGKHGAREAKTDYAIIFVNEEGEPVADSPFEQGNYVVTYQNGSFKFSPLGSKKIPWKIGENVTAFTNGIGVLVIRGTGAVTSTPWADVADEIVKLHVEEGVTDLGETTKTLPKLTRINGLSMGVFNSAAVGAVKVSGFSAIALDPATQMATLSVVVSRAESLDEPKWKPVSTNDIPVKADTPAGFFIVAPAK